MRHRLPSPAGSSRRRTRTTARRPAGDSPTRCPAASSTARSARPSTRCPRSRCARWPTPRRGATGYPPSIGTPALPGGRGGVDRPPVRRRRSTPTSVIACIGTKELVASLPHVPVAARPVARHRAVPGDRVPHLRDGRAARRACARCRCRSTTEWHLDLDARRADDDAERALCCGSTTRRTPPASPRRRDAMAASSRGRASAGSSWPATSATPSSPTTTPARRPRRSPRSPPASTACSRCTRSRSGRTWPGCAPGSSPATPSWSATSARCASTPGSWSRRRSRPRPPPRSATTTHVDEQRARYAARRALVLDGARGARAWCTPAARRPSICGSRPSGGEDGWEIAARLAEAGLLVAPGDLYGPGGADHARVALTLTDDRLELAQRSRRLDRAEPRPSRRPTVCRPRASRSPRSGRPATTSPR